MQLFRSRRSALAVVSLATAAVCALSACSSSAGGGTSSGESGSASGGAPASLVSLAKKDGSLTLYTGTASTQANQVAAAFQTAYGIKVNVVRDASGTIDSRYASEAQAGSVAADVVIQSDSTFAHQAYASGWTINLTSAVAPALADFPKNFVQPGNVRVMTVINGLEYNTDEVKGSDIPKALTDVLNPKFQGKILITDPRASAGIAADIYYLNQVAGPDFLTKLAKMKPKMINSAVPGLQQIASGEQWVMIGSVAGTDSELVKQGAPVKFVAPDNTSGTPQYMSVSKKAPHSSAARLFANFVMTKQGNQSLVSGGGVSPLGNLPGAFPSPKTLAVPDTDKAKAAANDLVTQLGLS